MINIDNGAALLDAVGAALPICRRQARRRSWSWGWTEASAEDVAADIYIYLAERGLYDASRDDISDAIAATLYRLHAEQSRQARLIELDGLPDYMDILHDPRPGPETATIINDILQCTDDKHGDIIRLIYMGYTDTEIANILHLARRTVYSRKKEIAARFKG